MLTKEGSAVDFNGIIADYINFLQEENDTTQSWDILDDRYNSFYGVTFSIPLTNYKIDLEYNKNILIIGDRYLTSSVNCVGGRILENKNDFIKVLKYVYPNANIDVRLVEQNLLDTTLNTLERVNTILTSLDEFPDILICNGIEGTTHGLSGDRTYDSYTVELLRSISQICSINNIELCMLATPITSTINNTQLYNNIETFAYSGVNKIYSLFSWMYLFGVPSSSKYIVSGVYDLISERYNRLTYNHINRYILREFFGVKRDEFYSSIQYNQITSSTYTNFLNNNFDYMAEVFNKDSRLRGKYGLNPFINTGELIAFGVHNTFDYKLWMCEQGGINCKYESDKEINSINLLKFIVFVNGLPSNQVDPPVFPGTGCPWLTVSDSNKSSFVINSENKIHYYFIKDNYSSTIVIRLCDGKGIENDLWQTVSFGKFLDVDNGVNDMPFYSAGGNQALSPDIWYYYEHSNIIGLSYDLDMKNPCFSNTDMLHPTKFYNSNLSNVRVMLSDGIWRDVYSYSQTFSKKIYFSFSPIYTYGLILSEVVGGVDLSDVSSTLYSGVEKTIDIYRGKKDLNKFISSTPLDSISFYSKTANNTCIGTIPNCYHSWSKTLPSGLLKYNNHSYLSIPCGWEGRLWNYPQRCGQIYWKEDTNSTTPYGYTPNDYVKELYHKLPCIAKNNTIFDKLVVDFGDAYNDTEDDLQIDFPEDYIFDTVEDKTKIMKLKIQVLNDNSDVVFCFDINNTNNFLIDFGDDTVSKFEYDSSISGMSHTYEESGIYYVTIMAVSGVSLNNIINSFSGVGKSNSFVYEVLDESYDGISTLLAIYLNHNYYSLYGSRNTMYNDFGIDIKNQDSLETIYLPSLCNSKNLLNRVNLSGSAVKDIYIYGENNDSVYINLVGCDYVENIYCDSHIDKIFTGLLPTYDIDIYMYTDNCFYIDYPIDNIKVHVKNSILNKMKKKYPTVTFVADI